MNRSDPLTGNPLKERKGSALGAFVTDRTLDRFRLALRFSLWVWALYWPGGGLLLLVGGLDPISIVVTFASLASFLVLMAGGALRPDASRNMKEFLVERPIYLVVVLVAFLVLGQLIGAAESFGLAVFAAAYMFGLGFAAYRLLRHVRATTPGGGLRAVVKSRADQAFLVFGLVGIAAVLVFWDAWAPLLGGSTIDSRGVFVAGANWVNLLYPPLLMLATKPFRAPLKWRREAPARPEPTPMVEA